MSLALPFCVSAGSEESLRLSVGHGGAGVRRPDGRRLHHHCVGKQHEQQRLRHRHAARQPLQRPLLTEVSDAAAVKHYQISLIIGGKLLSPVQNK